MIKPKAHGLLQPPLTIHHRERCEDEEKKNDKPNNVIFSRPVYGFPAYSLYGFASVQVGSVRLGKHTFSSAMTGSHLMCKKGRWDIRFLRLSPRLW